MNLRIAAKGGLEVIILSVGSINLGEDVHTYWRKHWWHWKDLSGLWHLLAFSQVQSQDCARKSQGKAKGSQRPTKGRDDYVGEGQGVKTLASNRQTPSTALN